MASNPSSEDEAGTVIENKQIEVIMIKFLN